jgi:hypothetical protein
VVGWRFWKKGFVGVSVVVVVVVFWILIVHVFVGRVGGC